MRTQLSALALAALIAAGCADTDNSSSTTGSKTIDVTMIDSKFEPAAVTVAKGEKVTLHFANKGALVHEAVLGTESDQEDHAIEMMSSTTPMGDMEGMHHSDTTKMVTLQPKTSEDIVTTFDKPGEYLIGCHQPGHWEAGMKAVITVTE